MNLNTISALIHQVETALTGLKAELASQGTGPVPLTGAAAVEPPPPAEPTFHAAPGGWRIDDVMPKGTGGTVTVPVTGHVISLPQPGKTYGDGEMFIGYCQRVHLQCGSPDANSVGALFMGTGHLFQDRGGFKGDGSNWPEAADQFFNGAAYDAARTGKEPPKPNITLRERYGSPAELVIALSAGPYQYAVLLNGASLHTGFGPADQFYTQADGSVGRTAPPKPAEDVGTDVAIS